MSKKKRKTKEALTPEISRELDKIKRGKQKAEKTEKESRPKEEKEKGHQKSCCYKVS